ncbi:MAG: M20/M25/M40 family metallo-hydrolase [Hyphomonas sp.]|nr:M20/M25/M40 family metallo-hydrolase [Hyphomonas sp.]
MSRRQTLVLAILVGVVAGILAWVLLTTGRLGDPSDAGTVPHSELFDAGDLLLLTETLSSDALEGRLMGSPGGDAARGFLRKRFEVNGLIAPTGPGYEQPFSAFMPDNAPEGFPEHGTNLVGLIEGRTPGEGALLVVTAHYDHVGIREGEIYNGADDNASGAAALTAVASYFADHPPEHDIVFVLFDGEEIGFQGSRYFIQSEAADTARMALNLNFDMVSRSDVNELYVCGSYHTPELFPMLEELAAGAPVKLILGHDRPEQGPDDWTGQSDHAVFHRAGIPFLYFGVEDHPDYHKPTDDFAAIPQDFFVHSVETLIMAARMADARLDEIVTATQSD